jgi:hypothetical protein
MIARVIIKGQEAATLRVQASYKIAKGITWIRSVTGAHCRPAWAKKRYFEVLKDAWVMLVPEMAVEYKANRYLFPCPLPPGTRLRTYHHPPNWN